MKFINFCQIKISEIHQKNISAAVEMHIYYWYEWVIYYNKKEKWHTCNQKFWWEKNWTYDFTYYFYCDNYFTILFCNFFRENNFVRKLMSSFFSHQTISDSSSREREKISRIFTRWVLPKNSWSNFLLDSLIGLFCQRSVSFHGKFHPSSTWMKWKVK